MKKPIERRSFFKYLSSIGVFAVASIMGIGFKKDEDFPLGKMKTPRIGVPEALGQCGMGLGCAGGEGQCGMGLGCAGGGSKSSGSGQCGMGLGCAGGGGECGMGLGCAGGRE